MTTTHPAKFSNEIISTIAPFVRDLQIKRIIDPFAGVGRLSLLRAALAQEQAISIDYVEIEPEWAAAIPYHPSDRVYVGDMRLVVPMLMAFQPTTRGYDALVTSPTYGNRMADTMLPDPKWQRHSYTTDLGRKLSAGNSGSLQWGRSYREFHIEAWATAVRAIRPGGYIILNISNHIRNKEEQKVSEWHVETLLGHGFRVVTTAPVITKRLRQGANRERVSSETVVVMQGIE